MEDADNEVMYRKDSVCPLNPNLATPQKRKKERNEEPKKASFSASPSASKNLQPLEIHTEIPHPHIRPRAVLHIEQTDAKVRRPARIDTHADGLILDPPEEPRHLPDLLPPLHLVLVPDPQRVPDAFDLDAQVEAAGVVGREGGEGPVCAFRVGDDGGGVARVVAELEADFYPLGGGRGGGVGWGRASRAGRGRWWVA